MRRNNRRGVMTARPRNYAQVPPPASRRNDDYELQDLDRELELLRMKRELIEEQRLGYSSNSSSRNSYESPQSSYSNQNYANLYQSSYENNASSWSGRKRPNTDNDRGNNAPFPKKGRVARDRDYNPPQQWSAPRPRAPVVQPRPKAPTIQPRPKPPINKAPTKPAPQPLMDTPMPKPKKAPNVPAAAAPKPKAPVAEPTPQFEHHTPYVMVDTEQPPSNVLHQIEYSVGALFREFQKRNTLERVLFSYQNAKIAKSIIRGRIRKVMLNKEFGNVTNVSNQYYAAYPKSSDKDLIALIQAERDAWKSSQSSEVPEIVNRTLSERLDELFETVKKMYAAGENEVPGLLYKLDKLNAKVPKKGGAPNKGETKKEGDATNADETAKDGDAPNEGETTKESDSTNESETKKESDSTNETDVKKEDDATNNEGETSKEGDVADKDDNAKEDIEQLDDATKEALAAKEKYLTRMVAFLIRRKLPEILVNHKTMILDVLNDMPIKKKPVTRKSTEAMKNRKFVSIVAQRALPKRSKLSKFLQNFNPAIIKKHKRFYNILFVGFDDEKSYQDILKSSGIAISNIELTIKPHEYDKPPSTNNDEVQIVEDRKGDHNESNTDLDNQIDELLTSIREEEEKANNETGDADVTVIEDSQYNTDVAENQSQEEKADDEDLIMIDDQKQQVIDLENSRNEGDLEEDCGIVEDNSQGGEENSQGGEENSQEGEGNPQNDDYPPDGEGFEVEDKTNGGENEGESQEQIDPPEVPAPITQAKTLAEGPKRTPSKPATPSVATRRSSRRN